MFATHLWVRAAAVMSGGAEEPSPVKAFLSPLNLVEYRNLLKEQGYDDPSDYDPSDDDPQLWPRADNDRTYEVPGADVPGVDSPGSGLTRPPAGARGRPGVGTHSGSALPRYDIRYESPGVPAPPLPSDRAPEESGSTTQEQSWSREGRRGVTRLCA